jgi:hypothetical protein
VERAVVPHVAVDLKSIYITNKTETAASLTACGGLVLTSHIV